jgi:NAD(P)-dependent dehydrogenase (short-subunit alcohol dehydrogenase family)
MTKVEVLSLFDVTGKVAIITGATGAFGSMAAKALVAMGAKVMLTGRSLSKLEQCVQSLDLNESSIAIAAGDPSDPADASRVVDAAVQRFGGIDILIAAAGDNTPMPVLEQSGEQWDHMMRSNMKSTYLFSKEAGRVMIKQGRGGKIIIVSSCRGQTGYTGITAYCSSKGAMNQFTRALACEWGPHKINVNCIAPAIFRAEMSKKYFADAAITKMLLARMPIGRLGEPEDFIGAVLMLSSAASDWMTGAILNIDGGFTAM